MAPETDEGLHLVGAGAVYTHLIYESPVYTSYHEVSFFVPASV